MPKFIQGRLIGSGTYAHVYEGIDVETKKVVALKKIELNEKEGMPSTALREISILKNLKHENIINLLQVIHTVEYLTMVMEFVEYDLLTYLSSFDDQTYCLINQLISGVHHLHINKIVHRDLKPGNILVTKDGVLKIADFGLARVINSMDTGYSPEVITLWYRPPELLKGATSYGYEVDIWSLGCIIYEMIAKKPLLQGQDKQTQLDLCNSLNIERLGAELTKKYGVPIFFVEVIKGCFAVNPDHRIKADKIVMILEKVYYNK